MACDYDNEWKCGDGENSLLKKILGRLKELVGLADPPGGGSTVTLTVSDIEIGAVEIKDGDTDARAKVITTCPLDTDRGLVVRNIPCGTQAVSVASLPLPAGAATEITLGNILSELFTANFYLGDLNTIGQQTMANSRPVVIASDQTPVPVSFGTFMTTCPVGTESGLIVRAVPCGTQAVSVASLPLPAGAATDANITAATNALLVPLNSIEFILNSAIDTTLSSLLSEATFTSLIRTTCPSGADSALAVRNIPCGTQAVSVSSLPLPAGAATEATLSLLQGNVIFYLPSIDNYLANIFSLIRTTCPSGADAALAVRNIPCGTQAISAVSLPLPTGAATQTTLENINVYTEFYLPSLSFIESYTGQLAGLIRTTCPSGADLALAVRNIPCGTQAISAASLPLPTGAVAGTQLPAALVGGRLDTNIGAWLGSTAPTVGQKTMAASLPVVIASDQSVISMQFGRAATYGCLTAELTLGTAIGKNRILSLFHPVGVTLTYEIMKVILFFKVTHTVGVGQYKITFTTVESATGTVLTPQQYRRSDANTGASVRAATTADGTLTGNPFIGYTKSLTPITGDPLGGMVPIYEHNAAEAPITLRGSVAEGILIYQDVTATLTTAPIVACRIVWREIV